MAGGQELFESFEREFHLPPGAIKFQDENRSPTGWQGSEHQDETCQFQCLWTDLLALLARFLLRLALSQRGSRLALAQRAQPQFTALAFILKPDRPFTDLSDFQLLDQLQQIDRLFLLIF